MIPLPHLNKRLEDTFSVAWTIADQQRHEYFTPEHILRAIATTPQFTEAAGQNSVESVLDHYIERYVPVVPADKTYEGASPSEGTLNLLNDAYTHLAYSGNTLLDYPHILNSISNLKDSYARNVLMSVCDDDFSTFFAHFLNVMERYDRNYEPTFEMTDEERALFAEDEEAFRTPSENEEWLKYVECLNDKVAEHNPLIGREKELERTMLVLCRKDKNNPVHVGEAGVGKTALAYGLAARIKEGNVPEKLKDCKIFMLDFGSVLASSQYRGELERILKSVVAGMKTIGNAILYIDEIHMLVGGGRTEGSNVDAANILKPYLEEGSLRFMGSTTYDEYNKSFLHKKAFARRFEKIDIAEPTVEEARKILHGLKQRYEEFHGVTFTDEGVDFAVEASARHITGKFLPDKAIDLLDEAGAMHAMHPEGGTAIGREQIAAVLAKVSGVEMLAEKEDDMTRLRHLGARLKSEVFGQDKAVDEVTRAVQLAAAGLTDDNKPMASLLFVGPTGVGKTEVAKVLAKSMGVPLVRFDMSEYAEKHTVAKLIGSPAGYVGYDEGGLLTDAVRKSPNCVLLFDELEKAHQDIYNILLQVMDEATLTDNKGQKTDFRNVVFIMTTNAGAQFARNAKVGFNPTISSGETMMKSVKKTFKPEFLNRLSGITVFRDMDREMASLVLDKKLASLEDKLRKKDVTMVLTPPARNYLLDEGFSEEYGGREIERVINSKLKPMLMNEILFGTLKGGGEAKVGLEEGILKLI